MNRIIEVLKKRDSLTEEEALNQLGYVRELVEDALANEEYSEVEEIVMSELGLEMDYIEDLLF